MWQNNRAERDKSHFVTRKCISTWRKRLLWSSTTLLFLSVSLLSELQLLPSAFWCALPQCFWAFVYRKKETFIYKESIKAFSIKDYLKQCSLERTKLSSTPTYICIYILAHHCTLCFETFHSQHVSLVNEWHSACSASVHSTAQHPHSFSINWKCWVRDTLLDWPGWQNVVRHRGWHVKDPSSVRALVPNLQIKISEPKQQ